MRTLKRNKRQIYYALFESKESIKDEYENETGEYEITYSDPVSLKVNISPARGESQINQFGSLSDYDRVIVHDNVNCPIDENSILWVDSLDTDTPHDYIVKRVAKGLNNISYAIKKVNVSEGDSEDEEDSDEDNLE